MSAPRGSVAIAAIVPARGPNPNRCKANAAWAFASRAIAVSANAPAQPIVLDRNVNSAASDLSKACPEHEKSERRALCGQLPAGRNDRSKNRDFSVKTPHEQK